VPIAQAALQFPLGHPAVSALVLGSVVPDEVRRNVAALAHPVPAGLWDDLKSEGLLAPEVPIPA
jgi:D-threo-aldose 1-dehydrogenase